MTPRLFFLASFFSFHSFQLYQQLHELRLADDQHDSESMTNTSVQIFTVPSLARWLAAEHGVVKKLLQTLVHFLQPAVDESTGTLNVRRSTSDTLDPNRYSSVLHDLKYARHTGLLRVAICCTSLPSSPIFFPLFFPDRKQKATCCATRQPVWWIAWLNC